MTELPLRMEKQLRFIVELDRLKIILRQTTVIESRSITLPWTVTTCRCRTF